MRIKKGTKSERLWHLFKERGKEGLTCHDAVMYAGYHRLAAFVFEMKGKSYSIESQWEKDPDGYPYKRYWLEEAANDGQRKSADTLDGRSANSKNTKK